ncbi:DUF881 domain-containing protein [Brevibacillus ginsengisoli]|uniref:DUF881 domain-containing protein n=1 Tax=Brevibacillus ginsengisoli TaxID=363854 RepID=UPI003CF04244
MLTQNRKITFILTTISAIIGLMLATQLQSKHDPKVSESRSITELRTSLQKELEKHKSLLVDMSKNEQLLYEYETSLNAGDSVSVMKDQLEKAKRLAGLVSSSGEGIDVRIVDAPVPTSPLPTENGQAPYPSTMVVDEDLRWLVNELFANGSTAVSINGQRLISTSSIRNVGQEIQVDTKPIRPPYEIKALGVPDNLLTGLKLAGVEDNFQLANKLVIMEKRTHMTISAYEGNRVIQYMKPVKAKGDS